MTCRLLSPAGACICKGVYPCNMTPRHTQRPIFTALSKYHDSLGEGVLFDDSRQSN